MGGGTIAIVFFIGTAVAAWYVLFGRTWMLKKQWNEGVLSKASALGAKVTMGGHYSHLEGKIVQKPGFFSWQALQFDGATQTRAYVMNGVPVEIEVAERYSYLNTNDWMTIVQAQYTSGKGPELGGGADLEPALKEKLEALEFFDLLSGGRMVTLYRKGVMLNTEVLKRAVDLASEIAASS